MKKYAALRTIATILKILGIISLVITILIALASCVLSFGAGSVFSAISRDLYGYGYGSDSGAMIVAGIVGGVIILLYGGLSSLLIYGGGEMIYVLLDMEQNTRETAELLRIASRMSENP